MNKRKDNINDIYRQFSSEMDRITLPSDEELMQLLDRHDAENRQRAPFIPLTPRRHTWRYVAAAVLVGVLAVFGWMFWSGEPSQGPITADIQTDSITTEQQPDTIVPTMPQPTFPDRDSRIAAIHSPDSAASAHPVVGRNTADTLSLPATPNVQQQTIAEQELPQPINEEQPADNGSDTTAPPQEPARGIEEYPQRPTTEETEKIIRNGNTNRRALRGNRKRHTNKKKDGFIDKKNKEREGLYYEIKTAPVQTPHFVPNGNGGHTTFYY